jgi:hypothetical protein
VPPVEPVAKAKFQTSVRRNGRETAGSVTTRVKLRKPTGTFQPWANRSPSAATNAPCFRSATQVLPVVTSRTQSQDA